MKKKKPFKTLFGLGLILGLTNLGSSYQHALTLNTGFYSLEGLGMTLLASGGYNYFVGNNQYIFQTNYGISSIEAKVVDIVDNTKAIFGGSLLVMYYEFNLIYQISRKNPESAKSFDRGKKKRGILSRIPTDFPYLFAGAGSLKEGSFWRYFSVLGIGNWITLIKNKRFGLRYEIRDQLFVQKILNEKFFSNNFILSLGIHWFIK